MGRRAWLLWRGVCSAGLQGRASQAVLVVTEAAYRCRRLEEM